MWLEQLSEEKYADLAGALLANGFIHLGYPRQARARLLVETRFGIAAELEQLPVIQFIQKLTEPSIDVPSLGETIKATFLLGALHEKNRQKEVHQRIHQLHMPATT